MRRHERDLIALAREFGAEPPVKTGSGHWKIKVPGKGQVIVSDTSGDQRTMKHVRADLRRLTA